MRGKAVQMGIRLVQPGITLAYAGKSDFRGTGSYRRRDHPRVCGEKHAVPVSAIWSAGSPPRVRGKASCILVSSSTVGITPAYAGKSVCNIPCANWQGDHPRVCGEKRTTAGRSSGACAATSNAIGMVTSALYRSAMSYTKEHSCPTCTNPSPGAHPSATMTAWASPYRQACTVGHTGAGAEQQHRNARRRDLNDTLFIRYGDGTVLTAQRAVFQVQERSSGPGPAAAPADQGGSCPAHHPWLLPPCRMVIRPRP